MTTLLSKTEKIVKLRETLPRGEKLFIIKRFASHAGDYRTLDVYRKRIDEYSAGTFANEDLKISLERITGAVCEACGYRYDRKHESLGIGGSGFNAAQEVVERIGHVLYSDVKAFEWQEL